MSILNRLFDSVGLALETSIYVTTRSTNLMKKTGRLSGIIIPEGFTLECNNFVWDKGDLEGYQRIISGSYLDLFVKHEDVELFTETNPPPEETAYVILYETDGTQRRFDEV